MSELASDRERVARAARGDQNAFRELYRAHVRPVYWIAHGILGEQAHAEDITQETFLVAWRKLPEFELASESLLPWLATICRFQAANRLRQVRRDAAHTTDAADEEIRDTVDIEEQVISAARTAQIIDALDTLSELDREIFNLCVTEGYAYQAAADELGVTHSVVRNRLSRTRTHLRGALSETSEA